MACLKKGRDYYFLILKLFKTSFVKLSYTSGCLSCVLSQIQKYGMHSSHSLVKVPFRHYCLGQKFNQFLCAFSKTNRSACLERFGVPFLEIVLSISASIV